MTVTSSSVANIFAVRISFPVNDLRHDGLWPLTNSRNRARVFLSSLFSSILYDLRERSLCQRSDVTRWLYLSGRSVGISAICTVCCRSNRSNTENSISNRSKAWTSQGNVKLNKLYNIVLILAWKFFSVFVHSTYTILRLYPVWVINTIKHLGKDFVKLMHTRICSSLVVKFLQP